jgi:hypothetical protein
MSDIPTPRTDKLFGGFVATDDGYWQVLDHARTLERELAAQTNRADNRQELLNVARAELADKDKEIASAKIVLRRFQDELLTTSAKLVFAKNKIAALHRVFDTPTTNLGGKST